MRDELYAHYDRELRFIRKLVWSFAQKYPEAADRLLLEPTKCEDPHVERIIEAFAMLTARIHLRLDDDFSEVTDALLGVLYPHFLNPIPSATIIQLELDPEHGKASEGVAVDRHSLLLARAVDGMRCRFRTCFPVRLWPVKVDAVDVLPAPSLGALLPAEARSALRIRLIGLPGVQLQELAVDRLAFFLDASGGLANELYCMFARDAVGVLIQRGSADPTFLGPSSVRPMGFERDEALLEYPPESFLGYRLLQEYFAFEAKFQFAEISGLPTGPAEPHQFIDVSLLLPQPASELDARPAPDNLRLGCTPAVNLFPQTADPIQLSHVAVEYPVVPEVRHPLAYEVHSIASITSTVSGSAERKSFSPFYGIRHDEPEGAEAAFWTSSRRPSMRKNDPGTDFFVSIVDRDHRSTRPLGEVLHVRTLCTNRDLPARIPFSNPNDLQLEGRPEIATVRCRRKPTAPIHAPLGAGSRWRIISHLALNHLSLANVAISEDARPQKEALAALQEVLSLYDFADTAVTQKRVGGLTDLRARRVVRRVGRGLEAGFARGIEVELELDEDNYPGAGAYLFASVLERFLGLYTSINSFTQTVVRARRGQGIVKQWPPRAGEVRIL